MANDIQNSVTIQTSGGPNVYFVIVTDNAEFWNGNDFEPYDESHWISYSNAMANIGGGVFSGTFPMAPAGIYYLYAYEYSTAPSPTDTMVGYGVVTWNGETEVTFTVDTTVIELDVGANDDESRIFTGISSIGDTSEIDSGVTDGVISIVTSYEKDSDTTVEVITGIEGVSTISLGVENDRGEIRFGVE